MPQANILFPDFVPDDPKRRGAFFTPHDVAQSLVRWAVHDEGDRLLDPSCGDGRFIASHTKCVGIEQDPRSAAVAMQRAPGALVHEGDFFTWAASTNERFECAAGNPPFIRYQLFKGEARRRALALCAQLGAVFSGLSSSWPLFIVATASLIKPGGRIAFVVPAEIGHAPYCRPMMNYLIKEFGHIQIIAVREKMFPDLSEDCWLLYADQRGGSAATVEFTILQRFDANPLPPPSTLSIPISEWRGAWNGRLRPFLISNDARALYRELSEAAGTRRLGDIASIGIGYVSGANDFFHLRPSDAHRWGIPEQLLRPTVRNGRVLPPTRLTSSEAVSECRRNEGWVVTAGCDSNGLSMRSWNPAPCGPQPPARIIAVRAFATRAT